MPLIDEQTRATDRRPAARWAWVLVVVGLCLLWMAVAVVISLQRRFARPASTPAAAVAEFNQQQLQQAQQYSQFGQWQAAAAAVQAIDATLPMSLSDKHTYLRLGGRSLARTGSPLGASRYYDRFLSLGT